MKKNKNIYEGLFSHEAKGSGYTIIGKDGSGEFVRALHGGRTSHDVYDAVYAESTGDEQNYITLVGSYVPSKILPLTEADREFLDDAYEANISYCHECNTAWDTDKAHYPDCEFQWTEDGLVCKDCFTSYIQHQGLVDYIDAPSKCLPLKTTEELAKQGKLKFIERFIGGMIDGRGGHYGGEYCKEGMPKDVLKILKDKHSNRRYVFSHDESGQFQTYWSVWQVKRGAK